MSNWHIAQNEGGMRSITYSNPDNRTIPLARPSTNNTKGAWTTITTNTPHMVGFYLSLFVGQNDDFAGLFDFAIGSAGNEVPIIENLGAELKAYRANSLSSIYIPITVQAGQRLSIRYQAVDKDFPGGAVICGIVPTLTGNLLPQGFTYCDTFGVNTTNSTGIAVPINYFPNVDLVEFVASTPRPYKAALLTSTGFISIGANINLWAGSAGNEIALIEQHFISGAFIGAMHGTQQVMPVNIPTGTRLSINCQSDGNGSTSNTFILHLFG